jgi:hypothetical protein
MKLRFKPVVPLIGAAMAAAALFAAGPVQAQRPANQPVGVAEETVVTGKIVDINPDTQSVMVQGPRGNVIELIAGDEVKNFGNIKKGDILVIKHGAALVAALEPLDSKATSIAETVERTSRAPEGGKPGIMREVTTTAIAQITKVDTAKRAITFRGPRETLRTVQVQDPSIDLTQIKTGQMAKIVYKEVVAIGVKAPGAPTASK